MARMRSPEITYINRLQPTSLEWNLFPKVSTPVEVTDAAPTEAPLWLQGAKIISTPGNSSSSSKCFPAPPERIDESHESHASRPEKKTNMEENTEKATEMKGSQEKTKTPTHTKTNSHNSPAPDPDLHQQSRSHPKGVHGRAASSQPSNTETAAEQVETEDELNRKNILVNEVERIFAIKERKHKFDWISILGLESGFKERDMDRRKRALLLILHPDKSGKFAKHAGGEERLKTYDFVDVAYSDAKKWLDQKNNGYLPPWERDPFSQAAAQPWQPPTRARPAAWTHGAYGASVSPHPPTTPTTTPTTPTTPRATTPTPRKAAPPPPPENFNKANKMPF